MKRYNIDICTCDGREAVNHTKDVPDNYGGWVKYDDAAARIAKLEAQLTAAKERERTLNDELYYACELAIAYAHSEKDKEWAAERIEELMPPEQESADDHK